MTELRLILAAVESPLADAWERCCGDVPIVTIHRGSILDVQTDAVVSPCNRVGCMDGGIDGLAWAEASERHRQLSTDRPTRLQH